MKKIMLLLFCSITSIGYAQNSSSLEFSVSGGISSPSSSFSDTSFASDGSFFELSSAYYFSKFGVGISIGSFSNPTEGDFNEFTNQLGYPVSNSTEDWKTSYYGIGPNVKLNLGTIDATLFARYGQMATKEIALAGNYTSENVDFSTTIPVYNLRVPEKTSSGYYNAGLKLGYKITENFSFYVTANYLSSTSDEIEIESRSANFQDLDGDGAITEQEILKLIGSDISYSSTSTLTKLSMLNYGFGLTYKIPTNTKVRKPMQDVKANKQHKENRGLLDFQKPDKLKNASGSIVFTNPTKERKKQQRKIILITPKNNSSFEEISAMPKFTWRTVGERIMQPKYGVTVEKINSNGRNILKTYFETGDKPTMNAKTIFKDSPENGNYRWKVTELSTGTTSKYVENNSQLILQ